MKKDWKEENQIGGGDGLNVKEEETFNIQVN